MKAAAPEAIAALPGFSLKTAQRILDTLHGRAENTLALNGTSPGETTEPVGTTAAPTPDRAESVE